MGVNPMSSKGPSPSMCSSVTRFFNDLRTSSKPASANPFRHLFGPGNGLSFPGAEVKDFEFAAGWAGIFVGIFVVKDYVKDLSAIVAADRHCHGELPFHITATNGGYQNAVISSMGNWMCQDRVSGLQLSGELVCLVLGIFPLLCNIGDGFLLYDR